MYKTHMYPAKILHIVSLTYVFVVASHRRCNETILEACHLVLQRWLCDLDPEHLDEESTGRPSPLSEAGNVVWWVRCLLCWRCSTRDVEWCGDTIYGIWWGCNDNRSCCCLRIFCYTLPNMGQRSWSEGYLGMSWNPMGRLTILQHQVVPGISWHAASLSEGATIFHRLFKLAS